ncbi:retrograde regulation protein 2 [Talaromyces proteolyticus]|uniref:Retrograde regulation protein 2 n=1 Tax=Talaromyces proteolyticus TaxID=1131652 RepID=A0AAD4KTY6_9EURO|nr:retrograde regulation protein 2 [Talaromyces proteolyticus]KAH8697045.1 retrograde regulation protein 2 [Talaromyces proteolyticus]
MTKSSDENFIKGEVAHDEIVQSELIGSPGLHNKHKSPLEKRLLLKADSVILPLAALAFFASYLDRNCIGNARVMGLQVDLDMDDSQFYNCLTMYFIGYILFVGFANVTSRKFKPNRAIGCALVFLGICLCGMGSAQNYATILALRIMLGFGCSFVPIITVYASLWYKRDELASRTAFGGLIAYGIQHDLTYTVTGRHPWAWLFLIEGLLAVFAGLLVLVLLPRFPDDLRARNRKHWLFTKEEIDLAADRYSTYNTAGEKIQFGQIVATFKDPKTYLFGMCQGASVLGVSVVGSFLPTFIVNLGFSALHTQLFSIIPYACAFFCVIFAGIMSDRWNSKGPFLFFGYVIGCIGYILLLSTPNAIVGIIAVCLITSGCYTSIILLPIWLAINTGGFTKRGSAWAFAELVGLCFSIMGTRIYTEPPRFTKGHSVVLSLNALAGLCAVASYYWMRYLNKKKDGIQADYEARGVLHPHIASHATLEEVCDNHITFRYVL